MSISSMFLISALLLGYVCIQKALVHGQRRGQRVQKCTKPVLQLDFSTPELVHFFVHIFCQEKLSNFDLIKFQKFSVIIE